MTCSLQARLAESLKQKARLEVCIASINRFGSVWHTIVQQGRHVCLMLLILTACCILASGPVEKNETCPGSQSADRVSDCFVLAHATVLATRNTKSLYSLGFDATRLAIELFCPK